MNGMGRMIRLSGAAAAAGCGLLGGLAVPPVSAAHPGPFDGVWRSIDFDGSQQTLTVLGSAPAARSVTLFDESASVCGGAPAQLTGPAAVSGSTLVVSGLLTCRPGGNQFRVRMSVGWTLDSGTDTLTDDFGTVWHRSA